MTPEGAALLKACEGCRLNAYLDGGGVPTIGYGSTRGVMLGDVWTQKEADARFEAESREFQHGVALLCQHATPHQLDAMTTLAYNIGLGAFKGSTVLREHNAGHYQAAADAFRLWNKDNGKIVQGLVNRREKERALYLT